MISSCKNIRLFGALILSLMIDLAVFTLITFKILEETLSNITIRYFYLLIQAKKCPFWNFEDELKSIDDSGCKAGMNCDKCHGWMEQRYHPQIFKKNKLNEMKQANLMIEKKINNIQKDKEPKLSKISLVVEEKVT